MNIRDGTEKGFPSLKTRVCFMSHVSECCIQQGKKSRRISLGTISFKFVSVARYYFEISCPLSKHSCRTPILATFSKILPDLYSLLTSLELDVKVFLTAVTTHWFYKFPHRWQLYHKKGSLFL